MERKEGQNRRIARWRVIAALLAATALLATACGGAADADGSGVATLGGRSGEGGGDSGDSGNRKDPLEAALEYAKCMRDHGVDMPDPKVGDNGLVHIGGGPGEGDGGFEEPDEEFLAADEKCRHLLQAADQGPDLSEEDQAIIQDAMLEYVECMRKEGIDMPDPKDGMIGGRVGDNSVPDMDDPDFRAADEKCHQILSEAEKRVGISTGRAGGDQ